MGKASFAAFGLLALAGCSDPETARSTLRYQNFTEVRITGWSAWGCGHGDDYCTAFVARAPNGECVEGVVGSGFSSWSKSATVRISGPSSACPVKSAVPQ